MRIHHRRLLAVLEPDATRRGESAFDLLHSERGFGAFEQWYARLLQHEAPLPEASSFWPLVFCPGKALHEHAFAELLRAFAECADSEANDLFDLLDGDFRAALAPRQVFLALCLVSSLASRQRSKLVYFHSRSLFDLLAAGSVDAPADRASWPRTLQLLRLLGARGHVCSRAASEHGLGQGAVLSYADFVSVCFAVALQLDHDLEPRSIVVHEDAARSQACAIL